MKEAYVKQSQSSSVKNTISDETEIFDPEIDFGEWCQQEGVGSPPSHASTETVTLILKLLEEKFSIQPRRRPRRSTNREPSHFSGHKELVHFPRQALPRIGFVLRKGSSAVWSVGNVRSGPSPGLSGNPAWGRGLRHRTWVLSDCSPGHASPRGALGEGKGTAQQPRTALGGWGRGGQRLLSFSES